MLAKLAEADPVVAGHSGLRPILETNVCNQVIAGYRRSTKQDDSTGVLCRYS
jgi:hypothetical protein